MKIVEKLLLNGPALCLDKTDEISKVLAARIGKMHQLTYNYELENKDSVFARHQSDIGGKRYFPLWASYVGAIAMFDATKINGLEMLVELFGATSKEEVADVESKMSGFDTDFSPFYDILGVSSDEEAKEYAIRAWWNT